MTIQFFQNLKAEFLKCRNTAAFWLTLGGAAFIPAINVIKCVSRPEVFVKAMADDPWKVWLNDNWQIAAAFFITMYVICVTSLIVQIEYRNNSWKQVCASPRTYADIFFTKVLAIFLIITSCFVMFNLFLVTGAYITGGVEPRYTFTSHPFPLSVLATTTLKLLVSILAITSLQYWMSLRFKNFIVPMGVGLGSFTAGFMIRQWEYIDYYPYMYPILVYFENPGFNAGDMSSVPWLSVVWCVAILTIGFIDLRFRPEHP
jgi:hypothetical protein